MLVSPGINEDVVRSLDPQIKVKLSCTCHEGAGGSRDIAPLSLNLDATLSD